MASAMLSRERNLILFVLPVLAVAAWVVVVRQSADVDMSSTSMATDSAAMQPMDTGHVPATTVMADDKMTADSQTMSMGLTMDMSAGLFLVIWVAMMVAMMFPTSAPMILTFA